MALGLPVGASRMFCSGWLSLAHGTERGAVGRCACLLAVSSTEPVKQRERTETSGTEVDEPRDGQRGTLHYCMACVRLCAAEMGICQQLHS